LSTAFISIALDKSTSDHFLKINTNQEVTSNRVDLKLLITLIRTGEADGWMTRLTTSINELHTKYKTSPFEMEVSETLCIKSIETAAVFLDWIPILGISDSKIAITLIDTISNPSLKIQEHVVEALLVLFTRNIKDETLREIYLHRQIFEYGAVQKLALAWCNFHGSVDINSIIQAQNNTLLSEDKYRVIKRFANV
jgi:hypothetical protein